MSRTGEVLGELKSQQTKGKELHPNLVAELCRIEPLRWLSLLLLDGIVPDPSSKKLRPHLLALFKAMSAALTETDVDVNNVRQVMEVTLAILTASQVFDAMRDMLTALPVWHDVGALLFRLAAFVESQVDIGMRNHPVSAEGDNTFDPVGAMRATLGEENSAISRKNVGFALEETLQCVELNVRYALHNHRANLFSPGGGSISSPYNDEDFERLMRLAGAWRSYEDMWAKIKFRNWFPVVHEKALYVAPKDDSEFLLTEAGGYRSHSFTLQLLSSDIAVKSLVDSDTHARVGELVTGMTLPAIGQVWDGVLDMGTLRACAAHTTFVRASEWLIEQRHYEPLAASLRVSGRYSWSQWRDVYNVVRVVGEALGRLARQTYSTEHGGLGTVFIVGTERLGRLVADALRVPVDDAAKLIRDLVFDEKRKHREVWDQPLLPYGPEHVIIVPAIFSSMSAVRALENLTDDTGGSFDVLGPVFEEKVEVSLRETTNAKMARSVFVDRGDGTTVECDLVCWWRNRLLLVESKCLKSIFSPADERRAQEQLVYACEQLRVRRELVMQRWASLRAAAPDLGLPERPPPIEQTISIALTNVFQFTSMESEGGIVADYTMLVRFFGEARAPLIQIGADGVRRVSKGSRLRGDLSPDELVRYLKAPPQMRVFKSNTKLGWTTLPVLRGMDSVVAVKSSEFNATTRTLFANERDVNERSASDRRANERARD